MKETIAEEVRRRVREAGAAEWPAIVEAVKPFVPRGREGKEFSTNSLRKIAYGERPNLGLKVAQALLDHFHAKDAQQAKSAQKVTG